MINSTCSSINVSDGSALGKASAVEREPFFSGIDHKAFDQGEQTKVGDIVLLKQRPTLECRYPLERYEISEVVYALGRIQDPLTGRRCNGLRFLDEPSIAKDRESQLTRPLPKSISTE